MKIFSIIILFVVYSIFFNVLPANSLENSTNSIVSPRINQSIIIHANITKTNKDMLEEVVFIPIMSNELSNICKNRTNPKIKKLEISEFNSASVSKHDRSLSYIKLGNFIIVGNIHNNLNNNDAQQANFLKKSKNGYHLGDNTVILDYMSKPLEYYLLSKLYESSEDNKSQIEMISGLIDYSWDFALENSYAKLSSKDKAQNKIDYDFYTYVYHKVKNAPANTPYLDLSYTGKNFKVDLSPQVKYNFEDGAVKFGFLLKIK